MSRWAGWWLVVLLLVPCPVRAIDVSVPPAVPGVTTLTGTANQVLVSASTGAVTLSLPQNVGTTSTPTFGGLTLTGTLAMGANAIRFTDLMMLRDTTTLAGQDKSEVAIRDGTNQQGFNIYRTFTDVNNYARFGLFWSGNDAYFGQASEAIAGAGAGGDLYVVVTTGQMVRLRAGGTNFTFGDGPPGTAGAVLPIALTLTTSANKTAISQSGYSLTGAAALPLADLAGSLNTSGVVDVCKLAITDTAHGAGSNFFAFYGGASGTTLEYAVSPVGATTQAGSSTVGCTTAPSTTAGGILLCATAFANLPADTNGTMRYCSDCDPPTLVDQTCTSAGTKTGSLAFRVNGAWKCVS